MSTFAGPGGSLTWALDPVDGTANLVDGIPLCGVSLGLIEDDRAVLGVIDLPFLGQRFKAAEGRGAYADGSRIAVSRTKVLNEAIVGVGDYAVGEHAQERNVRRLALTARLAESVLRVRMVGSAALDLVWVASGKLDVSIALSNHPWDMAAGVAIAREAGGGRLLWMLMGLSMTFGLRPPSLYRLSCVGQYWSFWAP